VAVILIIASIDAILFFGLPKVMDLSKYDPNKIEELKLNIILISTAATILIITGAYFFKKFQLSNGGKSVAKLMGAKELKGKLSDQELVFRNVVEEISIASGVVVPGIYILENEDSINAFAAGHDTNDCIICVTKGALELLDRDELQAVVAHEFGHIFNGDMKLNMKLISILFGILVIGEIGRMFMHQGHRRRGYRRSSSSSNRSSNDKSRGQIALIGFGIFAVGYIGHFFASLIQARISREREYLADSCSVQYTRNPDSLVRLFKKIYMQKDQWITDSNSKQVAHMFFSQGMSLNSFLATHPPLFDRIEHVDPKFNRERFEKIGYKEFKEKKFDKKWEEQQKKQATTQLIKGGHIKSSFSEEEIVKRVGAVDDASLSNSKEILNTIIPLELRNFFYKKSDCVLVMYSLFLETKNFEKRQAQYVLLENHLDELQLKEVKTIQNSIIKLPPKAKVSIIELCIPALKRLDSKHLIEMYKIINVLIKSDKRVDVREFLMLEVIESLIASNKRDRAYRKGVTLSKNVKEIEQLVSFWNIISHSDKDSAAKAFREAKEELGINISRRPKKDLSYSNVKESLEALKFLSSRNTERLIKALVKGILSDGVVKPVELMFLKMVCLVLTVPFPQID
jgi:Zn-dependent protease with chaperone function